METPDQYTVEYATWTATNQCLANHFDQICHVVSLSTLLFLG